MSALESDDRVLVTDTNPALAVRTEAIEKKPKPIMNGMQNFFITLYSVLTYLHGCPNDYEI
jgi:hypothetical protein